MNICSVLVWRGKDGEPAFDICQTRGWDLGTPEQMKELENVMFKMVEHQFGPKGECALKIFHVDRELTCLS